MINKKNKKSGFRTKFYEVDNKGKSIINHYKLIKFLGEDGYKRYVFENGNIILVRICDNIIEEVNEGDIANCVKDYLISKGDVNVLETFVKGISGYLNKRKYDLLPKLSSISDKDSKNIAWSYYENTAVKVTKGKIEMVPYDLLNHKIWKNRILKREFIRPNDSNGQFADFMYKLSKENKQRLIAARTAIGFVVGAARWC